jgi:hypothetical protein
MTPNDAAAVLEHIVEKRGAEWVASNWGLDREQLARWYEGQEELPPDMVFAMRVWVSALKQPKGEAGCFEDADDHPPEVPEDVTETGVDAVPMPTSRALTLWEAYRSGFRELDDDELDEMEEEAWAEAGRQCGVDDAMSEWKFLPEIMPITAWDKSMWWPSLIRKLAGLVRCEIEGDDR